MAVANRVLTTLTRAAFNEDERYIAPFLFPFCVPSGIEKKPGGGAWTATARRISKQTNVDLGEKALLRAPLTAATRGSSKVDDYTITINEYAYEEAFDAQTGGPGTDSSTANQLEQEVAARKLAAVLKMALEQRASTLIKTTGTFSQGLDAASAQWINPATNVVDQLKTAYNAVLTNGLQAPTRLAFSKSYWDAFIGNPYVQNLFGDALLNMSVPQLQERISAVITGFNPSAPPVTIRVASAVANTANAGQSASDSFLYADHAVLFYAPDGEPGDYIGIEEQAAGKTYEALALTVDSRDDNDVIARVHRACHAAEPTVFDATLAYCFRNAV